MSFRYYYRFPEGTTTSELFKHGCKFITRTGHRFSFEPKIETIEQFLKFYENMCDKGRVLFIDDTLNGSKSFVTSMQRKFGGIAFKERYGLDGGLLEVVRL